MICMGDSLDSRGEYWQFGDKFSNRENFATCCRKVGGEVYDGLEY